MCLPEIKDYFVDVSAYRTMSLKYIIVIPATSFLVGLLYLAYFSYFRIDWCAN